MRFKSVLKKIAGAVKECWRDPSHAVRHLALVPFASRGFRLADYWLANGNLYADVRATQSNPLYKYFMGNTEGPGIVKWKHYFDVYDRHFSRFRGSKVNLLEIGVYSGGSLPMWLDYFGKDCRVWGLDIEEACKCYEADRIHIEIGDQGDREFWRRFRNDAPPFDILIDDGGHTPEQQMTTLEEMLPFMPSGSVYVCEDIHGKENQFAEFATSLVHRLNRWDLEGDKVSASDFQRSVASIHFYPFLCVIEKYAFPPQYITSVRNGTDWQPFPMGTR